ncbi:MAG: hypothetical protein WBB39_00270 [Candidatus Saccharimonadales bacterium]
MFKQIILDTVPAYCMASASKKTQLITGIVTVSGMQRKAVIRALNRERKRSHWNASPKLGRPKKYSAECEAALAWIWEQYDYPSAERLYDERAEAVRIFIRDGMWHYSEQATQQLLAMTLISMKRRTTAFAKKRGLLRGASTTRSGPILSSVPVFFGSWTHKGPGHGQVDTVVHSGPKLMGTMAYTVNYVDVATYWQEPVAQLSKEEAPTIASLQVIARRLPWLLRGLHPDSGSEFINEAGITWCRQRRIELTRSRPNKKNDNCYIEQRNLVVVRKYVGYERYDCREAVTAMNELYEVLRLYLNFFQPTFKLQGKEKRVATETNRQTAKPYKRIYDKPQTPYRRVLERADIEQKTKDELTRQYEHLNPTLLRDRIQLLTSKLERIQREQGYHF